MIEWEVRETRDGDVTVASDGVVDGVVTLLARDRRTRRVFVRCCVRSDGSAFIRIDQPINSIKVMIEVKPDGTVEVDTLELTVKS